MAITVEDGSSNPLAESYASVTTADAYHALRGNILWTGDDPTKEAALRKATTFMDGTYRTRYIGRKRDPNQRLAWPRINAVDLDGWLRPLDSLPPEVVDACCEAALRSIEGNVAPDVINSGVVTYFRDKVGPLEQETHYLGGDLRTRYLGIEDILSGIVRGRGSVELVRS